MTLRAVEADSTVTLVAFCTSVVVLEAISMDLFARVEAAVWVFVARDTERREVFEMMEVVTALVVLAVEEAVFLVADLRLSKSTVDLSVSVVARVDEFEAASKDPVVLGVLTVVLHQSILEWIDLTTPSSCCNTRANPALDSSATRLAETVVQATPSLTTNNTVMREPINQGLASSFQAREVAENARVERTDVLCRAAASITEDFWIPIAVLCTLLFVARSMVMVVATSHDLDQGGTEAKKTAVS
jgi:hypothetical protein